MTTTKSNQRTKKDPLDRYYTPAWVTEILVEHWPFPEWVDTVWEPCVGQGHILDVVFNNCEHVNVGFATDADPEANGAQHDFLRQTCYDTEYLKVMGGYMGAKRLCIVTNPPYTIPGATAADFVRRALEYTPYVAMLLRLSWLEACEDRKSIFAEQPPAEVWILPRVKFEGPNTNGGSPSSTSAWFIWKPGATETKLTWVKTK